MMTSLIKRSKKETALLNTWDGDNTDSKAIQILEIADMTSRTNSTPPNMEEECSEEDKTIVTHENQVEKSVVGVKDSRKAAPTSESGGGVTGWLSQKLHATTDTSCGDALLDVASCSPTKMDRERSALTAPMPPDFDDELSTVQEKEELTGVEVEVGSSCNNDDCLHRKRWAEVFWIFNNQKLVPCWFRNRRRILLGSAFVSIFLFGVLIGACGSGQCRASSSSFKSSKTLAGGNTESSDKDPAEKVDTDKVHLAYSSPNPNAIVNDKPGIFGPQTFIITPLMTTAEINGLAMDIFEQQQNNEMGRERYALLFEPGTYGSTEEPIMLQIGYYTEVAGLGESPNDVKINGKIEVYNRCFEPDPYVDGKFIPTSNSEEGLCFALNSFWRALSNLSIQIVSRNQDPCRATAMFWAISQASSMRRVHVEGGDMSLMDYCSDPAYASGGFIADSKAEKIISGGQQQFITRNAEITEWDGSVWNQFLLGVDGAPGDSGYPDPAVTSMQTNPASREKPYLFVDEAGDYYVRVPSFARNTNGITWSQGTTPGRTIPISDFYIADENSTVSEMNSQLKNGKHLLFTPGQYNVDEPIVVDRENTVVLGFGIPTLTAEKGAVPMKTASKPGIIIAGITLDGGLELSPVLLQIGELGDSETIDMNSTNPITLSDIYFRIGGPHVGKANVCLEINSNHVLVDHTWVWRADHGVEDFDLDDGFEGDNERWRTNIGLNGMVVNGHDVTATGLFVEHYQEYNLVWNGERGRVYFFQNELPYEPPSQEEWMADDGAIGWAAYKVNDDVVEHELWNGGVYCYMRNNPDVVTANGYEVPKRDGVTLNRIMTRNLSGPGTITNIVNGVGEEVNKDNKGPFYVVAYPQ